MLSRKWILSSFTTVRVGLGVIWSTVYTEYEASCVRSLHVLFPLVEVSSSTGLMEDKFSLSLSLSLSLSA